LGRHVYDSCVLSKSSRVLSRGNERERMQDFVRTLFIELAAVDVQRGLEEPRG
jgi:hypothetical protein